MKGQWKPQTEYVTLPSGNQPRIRRIDVVSLVLDDGNIPDTLLTLIMEGGDISKAGAKDSAAFMRMLNQMARACFEEPRIVDKPNREAGEISIIDVDPRDKLFLWQHLMGGMTMQAARFPEEQGADGQPASEGKIIREVAK